VQRWLAFQEMSRQKGYLDEKAMELYAFQKIKYRLKDDVSLINDTNAKHIYATTAGQTELADRYLQRIMRY
jgi:hypothetical protein